MYRVLEVGESANQLPELERRRHARLEQKGRRRWVPFLAYVLLGILLGLSAAYLASRYGHSTATPVAVLFSL